MENTMEILQTNAHGFEVLGFSALHGTEKTFAAIRFSMPNFRAEQTNIIPMDSIRSAELKKTYSTKAILNGLDPLLVFNNEGRSHHLPRPLRKHEKNKRFSALSVSALTDRILQKSSSYWDYCGSPIKELRKNKF